MGKGWPLLPIHHGQSSEWLLVSHLLLFSVQGGHKMHSFYFKWEEMVVEGGTTKHDIYDEMNSHD